MFDTQPPSENQLSFSLDATPPKPVTDWRDEVPSVSQLTRRIRGHIENSFFDVWVKGEISNFRKPVSGHAYFMLKDATSMLKAVMFRQAISKLKFDLKDGMEILLHGQVTVYEARGEYQLVADTLEPVGVGALQLAFQQLKERLEKEGLFDKKFKKPLPFLPRRIAIITSATGAAVRDILKVLGRRFPNLHLLIIPASVQGEKAAGEICLAFETVQRWNDENPTRPIDVVIAGRGGGSLEDLWPFNEECVARAIFQCQVPVISAVGHEVDFTIADFVADLRAPTPSAAAEVVVPRKEDLRYMTDTHLSRVSIHIKKKMQQYRLHLGHLGQRLVDPREKLQKLKEKFNYLSHRMNQAMLTQCVMAKRRVESNAQLLNSLSPLQTIGRGFSLTHSEDGSIVKKLADAPVGKILKTQVSDGTIYSQVTELRTANE